MPLDRMAIEDIGTNPEKLALAIHRQLELKSGWVRIDQVALALDIDEIRIEELRSFEGALLTTPERDVGKILVNGSRDERRRRFTIAHELGHFLSPWHVSASPEGFLCSKGDLRSASLGQGDRHRRQEVEANRFAIEVLAPRYLAKSFLAGAPTLAKAIDLANELNISRESASRRYVELHEEALAVVFSQNGRIRYFEKNGAFPHLDLQRDQRLPEFTRPHFIRGLTDIEVVDGHQWLSKPGETELMAQSLLQEQGWVTTLLHAVSPDGDEDDTIEDTFQWFSAFNRRDD